jgi:hypothetical protein
MTFFLALHAIFLPENSFHAPFRGVWMWLVFVRWTTADSTKYRIESCSGLDRDLLQEASPTWQTERKTLLAQILKIGFHFCFRLFCSCWRRV